MVPVPLALAVLIIPAVTSQSAVQSAAVPLPRCGLSLLNNSEDFLVSAYSYLRFNDSAAILEAAGWNASVSSVIAGCGGSLVNGTFEPPSGDKLAECKGAVADFGAKGVCWEGRIYVDSPGQMHRAAQNASKVAASVAFHARLLGLSGVSFDWEKKGESKKSHKSYLEVTSALRSALNPIGVRVSSFSNNFYHDIRSFKDLGWHNDKVMCGETYVGNTGRWREQYHRLLRVPDHEKMSPVLQCDTKHGKENCARGQIGNRIRLIAENFTELSVFSLNGFGAGHMKGPCFAEYVPFLQAFRNGTIAQGL